MDLSQNRVHFGCRFGHGNPQNQMSLWLRPHITVGISGPMNKSLLSRFWFNADHGSLQYRFQKWDWRLFRLVKAIFLWKNLAVQGLKGQHPSLAISWSSLSVQHIAFPCSATQSLEMRLSHLQGFSETRLVRPPHS